MQAGKLNRRATIQKLGEGVDELGEPIPGVWVDVATVWADVRHNSGMETIKSDIDVSIVKASIRIRRRTDITAGMRVLADGKVYDIRAVMDDVSGRVFSDLVCETGANQG